MRKVTLVIDEPIYCDDCPLMFENDCGVMQIHMQLEYGELHFPRPSWCPLKPIPQRRYSLECGDSDGNKWREPSEYDIGYNECIDELLGVRDE